jgi:tol-pal system protein YbgF
MLFRDQTRVGAVLLAALAGVACAHEPPSKVSLAELNRTVASLRAQNAAYERQVQELENRVFILGDQLDSRKGPPEPNKTAAAQDLPKVTLHPADKASHAIISEPPDEPAEPEVEYAGDAARSTGKRPLLRLYGDETPVLSGRSGREISDEPVMVVPRRLAVAGEGSQRPSSRSAALSAQARASTGTRAAASEPAELYRRSLEALRGGRHEEAAAGFREFLKLHGNHDYADNAQYWLAECYYDQKDYPTAVREFRRVLEKYPQGNKVPDALLKVGFCHLALGSTEVGRQTLVKVVHGYPRHGAAGLASTKLAELAQTATAPRSTNEEVP